MKPNKSTKNVFFSPLTKFNFVVLIVIALSGCMTAVHNQAALYRQGSFPILNKSTSVSVGQTMVEVYDYSAKSRAVLGADVPGNPLRLRKAAALGSELKGGVSGGDPIYCISGWGSPCFKDLNNDGHFDQVLTQNAYGDVVNSESINPVSYTLHEVSMGRGFKNELVYQGIEQNVVKIIYREFQQSLVQADKNQELSYTLNPTGAATAVSFRNAQLLISKADNNQITFKVMKGL